MTAPNADITPESLAADAAAVAAQLGVTRLPLVRFQAETGVSLNQVYKHYDIWGALCRAAGLVATSPTARLADEQIFADLRDAFIAAGASPRGTGCVIWCRGAIISRGGAGAVGVARCLPFAIGWR